MGMKEMYRKFQAPMSMLLVQLFMTGMLLLSKIVLNKGAFVFSLLTYRLIVATVSLAPFAYFFERNKGSELNWRTLFWISLSGLLGLTMAMGFYYYGLSLTSASYSSNFLNMIPVVTFILSIISRVEKLGLRTRGGKLKVAGTLLCVAGAMCISLFKGKSFSISHSAMQITQFVAPKRTKVQMMIGSLLLMGNCLSSAAWFLVQVKLHKVFPSRYWATMLSCLAACFQSAIIGVAVDRRKDAWRIGWDLQLLTIVYSGVLTTSANFCLISWAVARQGPTYPSMFNPLALVLVTILEFAFMGQEISVGSILGAVMIIGGLYAFLWGKRFQLPPPITRTGDQNQLTQPNVGIGDIAIVLDSSQSNSAISPVMAPHDSARTGFSAGSPSTHEPAGEESAASDKAQEEETVAA